MQSTMFDRAIWDMFVQPGEVVEIRAFMTGGRFKKVIAGYFDDHDAFKAAAMDLDAKPHEGVYFTLQVIDPRLIARAFNRMREGIATTADNNVIAYRWVPIDIDPVRPAGIGSSDTELGDALLLRRKVCLALANEFDTPASMTAVSGNGGHILVRLPDIPVDEASTAFVKGFLGMLDKRFSTQKAKIDTAVFNPGRIWKLYGTTARKGEDLTAGPNREARPYRKAYIDSIPGAK